MLKEFMDIRGVGLGLLTGPRILVEGGLARVEDLGDSSGNSE